MGQKIVVSMPLHAEVGRDAVAAAQLALADAGEPLELLVLDAADGAFRATALRAAGDPSVVAYVGDFRGRDPPARARGHRAGLVLEHAPRPGRVLVLQRDGHGRAAGGRARRLDERARRAPPFLLHAGDYGFDMRRLVHRELAAAGVRVLGAAELGDDISSMREADGVFGRGDDARGHGPHADRGRHARGCIAARPLSDGAQRTRRVRPKRRIERPDLRGVRRFEPI